MYGIVNNAIKDLVSEGYGPETWELVRQHSSVENTFFISSEPYDDAITYRLATAVAEVANITVDEVLISLGKWWILRTGKEKYGGMMEAGGRNLKEFLINLPVFHSRVMLMYPKLSPPEFQTSDVQERSIHIHYRSSRQGLQAFVRGLLEGLALMYQTDAQIELLQDRDNGATHEIFKVSW
jgi:hypothetical protein